MSQPYRTIEPALRRRVGRWLALWAVMVALTVVIGGVTRLTEAGLSITEWKPVSGVLPPLTAAGWEEAFAQYRQIPEYRELNAGMTLAAFRRIFYVEYLHRLWARLVGLAFAVPLAVFLVRRGLGRALSRRLLLLLVLMGLQGGMGWYMVQSGLTERTDVSQYRLAAHLALALLIFAITVWTAAALLTTPQARPVEISRGLRRLTGTVVGLVFLTAIAGAFVAGLDAGRAYNTFPLMGGRVIPAGYLQLEPWYRNVFEHVPAVQFNHRLLGLVTLAGVLGLWGATWRATDDPRARRLAGAAGLTALAQAGLGVATLVLAVPIPLAALHQAGAVMLLGFVVVHWERLQGAPYSSVARAVDS